MGTFINSIVVLLVYDAPRVISVEQSDVKSVTEGDPVTLNTDVQTQSSVLILWRFGPEGVLIAKDDKEDNNSSIYDVLDGKFRDRLKLDDQTGSLTITNSKTTDTGVYNLQIINNRETKNKMFSVSVSKQGQSSGWVAGIIFGVLLLISAVVFSYRRKNYKQQKQKVKEKTVIEGDTVTLYTGVTKLQSDEVIEWMFRDKVIAGNKISNDKEKFRDRLRVDEQTGSLTIRNITTQDAGLYKVKMSSSNKVKSFLQFINGGGPSYSQFNVIVKVKKMENGSVTLPTGVTARQSDDEIQWRFGETLIAEFNKNNKISTHDDVLDGIFRDKLKLNYQTRSLTITDLGTEHTGEYKLKIINSRGTSCSQFKVIVEERIRSVELGDSVTLKTGVTGVQANDEIQWRFGDEDPPIAQLTVGSEPSYDSTDERFRNKLKINPQTGQLTITNITTELTGVYKAKIISRRRGTEYRTYRVVIRVSAVRGESFTLYTDSEIQRGSEIEWISGDNTRLVTEKNGDDRETKYANDERFRDRLEMNPQTGDLTIRDIRDTDMGLYTLQLIKSDGKIPYRIFKVDVWDGRFPILNNQNSEMIESVDLRGSVTLNTDVTEVQTDDEIQWTFGDEEPLIAQLTVGSEPSYNSTDERFRDRLKMNPQTGDLTITNITPEVSGDYREKINSSSRGTEYKNYKVAINVSAYEKESVTLHTDSEIQSGSEIEISEDDGETQYTDDERFTNWQAQNETGDRRSRVNEWAGTEENEFVLMNERQNLIS